MTDREINVVKDCIAELEKKASCIVIKDEARKVYAERAEILKKLLDKSIATMV